MTYHHTTASAFTIGDRVELLRPHLSNSVRRVAVPMRGNVTNTTAHFVLVCLDRDGPGFRVFTPTDLRIVGEA